MKKYKVLKEFINPINLLHFHIGEEITHDCVEDCAISYFSALIQNGFLKEIPERPKTVWDLEGDTLCWYININSVLCQPWGNIIHAVDRRMVGNVFLTEEEAQKELARRKAKTILERDTQGYKPDWSKQAREVEKWLVIWDIDVGDLDTTYTNTYCDSRIYFATEEDARASIKTHKKEWLIYLRVEE